MRSIFFRLLLNFSLTILLTGLISGLVIFSISRRSVDSFRHNFLQQLQTNIARGVVLMGQAAYVMRQYRGNPAFIDYTHEINALMRTQLYLCIDDVVFPSEPPLDQDLLFRIKTTTALTTQPFIEDDGRQLIVAKRLQSPEGKDYLVIGLHHLGPPPGMEGLPPPDNGPGRRMPPPPPHELERSFSWSFWGGDKGVRLLVFLLVAGVICYLLARSYSAPLARLQRISRQIAAGDLSARVGTSLGKPGNEIGDLARDFDHMAERMEGLVYAQKRLLLDISHELRSPLARLNLALELAKKRFDAENDDILARIGRESERLNALIGQLLTLTRSEAFVVDQDTPEVDLPELIKEIAGDVGFETSDQQKSVDILDLEPLTVVGSYELLHQAIENVVRNGAYYTRPDTGVTIRLFSTCDESEKTWAIIQVRDHGPGVPEDAIPHLKNPFFRVAEARDRNSGGTGLGLAIAHQVVQQHGGHIAIRNKIERGGLIVEIYLPLQRACA
ncbi:MAG: ATP-binding protein [Desulfobulbus sp.]|nr:ATP-binding protein [Desulfobulbus sp.]